MALLRLQFVDDADTPVSGLSVLFHDEGAIYPSLVAEVGANADGIVDVELPDGVDIAGITATVCVGPVAGYGPPVATFRLGTLVPGSAAVGGAASEIVRITLETDVTDGIAEFKNIDTQTQPGEGEAFVVKGVPKTANLVRPFVDNAGLWAELGELASSVKPSVPFYVTQLLWAPNLRTKFLEEIPDPAQPDLNRPVKAEFFEKIIHDRKLNARVVMWLNGPRTEDSTCFGGFPPASTHGEGADAQLIGDDSSKVKKRFPSGAVRGFVLLLLEGAFHAKSVVAGNRGYMLGSPFDQRYFDGPGPAGEPPHRLVDGRRGQVGGRFAINVPIHDVSVGIHGEAAKELRAHFKECWNNADFEDDATLPKEKDDTKDGPEAPARSPSTWRNCNVQIVRTLPGQGRFRDPKLRSNGDVGILNAYELAIKRAQKFIYLETQYLTEARIAEDLLRRMFWKRSVHVILLLNMKLDFPVYLYVQNKIITAMLDWVSAKGFSDRFGVYTRWRLEKTGQRLRIVNNYIHSKVGIIDDEWATIGSANLDQAGLTHSPVYERFCGDVTRRSVEVNAVLTPLAPDNVPLDLRKELWSEHLGADAGADAATVEKPAKLWADRAKDLVDKISLVESSTSCVLPYVSTSGLKTSTAYLERVFKVLRGSSELPSALDVYTNSCSYDLDKGAWLRKAKSTCTVEDPGLREDVGESDG